MSYLGEVEYNKYGIPVLTEQRLRRIAAGVLSDHAPASLRRPTRLVVRDLLNFVQERCGTRFELAHLGERAGRKIVGITVLSENLVRLDKDLRDTREDIFRFTAAHEIGHVLLHRSRPIRSRTQKVFKQVVDDERALQRFRIKNTPQGWMEYQANTFAAYLLMPSRATATALIACQRRQNINQRLGQVYVNPRNLGVAFTTIDCVRSAFGVSRTVAKYHLEHLGRLENAHLLRGKGFQRITA